jgi:hypothetical protein
MRAALQESIARAGGDRWAAGSIVVCTSCGRPIYRLTRGIGAGEKVGRSVEAFAPVEWRDIEALIQRQDLEPGLRARWRSETREQWRERLAAIPPPRSGDPCKCPLCTNVFVQARAGEPTEFLDRAYVVELVTIPPEGAA